MFKYPCIVSAVFLLTACSASLPPQRAECQPIPKALRTIPPKKLPVPRDNTMGALEVAYIGAAEQYHKSRRDAIALDAAIEAREGCYAAER